MIWMTPAGHPATFAYRDGTNDWNVINSVTTNDEYALPTGLSGWALDIGAHLGSVSVALALDNPGLQVLAVEPLEDNLRFLRANIAANGLTERITVIEGVAGTDPLVTFGGRGSSAEHHGFIGNNEWSLVASGAETMTARCWSLAGLIRRVNGPITFAKIDCEGCEWSFLDTPLVARLQRITGEWHPPGTAERLAGLLVKTHELTFIGEHGFAAVRRA